MTDGRRPLVYDAVNSQGSPDLKHSAHGHRPLHLVFFLFNVTMSQPKDFARCARNMFFALYLGFQHLTMEHSLLTSITRPANSRSLLLLSLPLRRWLA
jgi:hypothetical protein